MFWKRSNPLDSTFAHHFQEGLVALTQVGTELIKIDSLSDLQQIIDQFRTEQGAGKDDNLLEVVEYERKTFVVKTTESVKDLVLHIKFLSDEEAIQLYDRYIQGWLSLFDIDKVSVFFEETLRKKVEDLINRYPNDSLFSIWSKIDALILSQDKVTSEHYLAEVLGVPKSVWVSDPDRALVERLQIERHYKKMRDQLYAKFLKEM